jgi:hypothetical protein
VIDREIDEAIGTLPDIADAAEAAHHRFACDDARAIERDAIDALAHETAREELTLPARELVARVEHRPDVPIEGTQK